MKIARLISAIDSHTAGENARVVIGGIPHIPGETMVEKMGYFKEKMKDLRTALLYEPRGWSAMWSCILTAPTIKDADLGIIFMGAPGGGAVPPMCGHLTIAATTVVVETGIVKATEPITTVKWDTAAGLVTAKAEVKDGRVLGVTMRNVPSFLYKKDVPIEVPGLGKITVDISYAGAFMVMASAKSLGVRVRPENASQILDIGERVTDAANDQIEVSHPEKPHIKEIVQTRIHDDPLNPAANSKNAVVCCHGPGFKAIDRSPCGTGTCAEMAQLYARGKLKLNQEFVSESIVGSLFKGRLIDETRVGNHRAVIPEVTGNAYITGIHQIVIDPDDPLKHGFLL